MTMVWVVSKIRLKVETSVTRSHNSINSESTTEISSLEGTSPRETASTSAHRVPNTLIADYGRKEKNSIIIRVLWHAGFFKVFENNFIDLCSDVQSLSMTSSHDV